MKDTQYKHEESLREGNCSIQHHEYSTIVVGCPCGMRCLGYRLLSHTDTYYMEVVCILLLVDTQCLSNIVSNNFCEFSDS